MYAVRARYELMSQALKIAALLFQGFRADGGVSIKNEARHNKTTHCILRTRITWIFSCLYTVFGEARYPPTAA